MGFEKVKPCTRGNDWCPLECCSGYDPYNSADRIERVTLRSEDCIGFELGSESDANRALAEGKPSV